MNVFLKWDYIRCFRLRSLQGTPWSEYLVAMRVLMQRRSLLILARWPKRDHVNSPHNSPSTFDTNLLESHHLWSTLVSNMLWNKGKPVHKQCFIHKANWKEIGKLIKLWYVCCKGHVSSRLVIFPQPCPLQETPFEMKGAEWNKDEQSQEESATIAKLSTGRYLASSLVFSHSNGSTLRGVPPSFLYRKSFTGQVRSVFFYCLNQSLSTIANFDRKQ